MDMKVKDFLELNGGFLPPNIASHKFFCIENDVSALKSKLKDLELDINVYGMHKKTDYEFKKLLSNLNSVKEDVGTLESKVSNMQERLDKLENREVKIVITDERCFQK
jgi:predicted  nucleic acid-binding Zn-ribbon protein